MFEGEEKKFIFKIIVNDVGFMVSYLCYWIYISKGLFEVGIYVIIKINFSDFEFWIN